MEIKEGMYVRYKRIGDGMKIAKIKEILPPNDKFGTEYYKFDAIDGTIKTYIKKASYDILELIQENDYVNGSKVLKTNCSLEYIEDTGASEVNDGLELENGWVYFESEIKSVVTKEQFKNMEYEVE